ncbi:hypothetical protein ABZV67_46035 [Streptomyces sp. NPDC005065]|uniref:hypothetical protein n=1 Tax=Streptomyces sp. NPDC005065 TaxID=3154461 RepID=UPI0033AD2A93
MPDDLRDVQGVGKDACVRCPMLWPDPVQRDRLVEIRDNFLVRIAEVEREGWLGEVEGLQVSVARAQEKLDGRPASRSVVDLGIPTVTIPAAVPHQHRREERM